jgi:hypothetical protein
MRKLLIVAVVVAVAVAVVAVVALLEDAIASSKIDSTVGDLTDAMVKYPPMNGIEEFV